MPESPWSTAGALNGTGPLQQRPGQGWHPLAPGRCASGAASKGHLSVIALVQDRPELEQLVKLKYGPHTLPWSDYFFDRADYQELYDYLRKHRQFWHDGANVRPVALVFKPWRGRNSRITLTAQATWQIRGSTSLCVDKEGNKFNLFPTLYVKWLPIAKRIFQENFVLVCGIPKISRVKTVRNSGFLPLVDLTMDIVDDSQVCQIHPLRHR